MAGPPIRDGAVLVDLAGRIAAIGPNPEIPADNTSPLDLGSAILLPGLVNTHTHLELTGFDRPEGEPMASGAGEWDDDFVDWIRTLLQRKAQRTPADFLEAARSGLRDCHAAGVTTVADTGDSGAAFHALSEAGGSGIAYLEVFGPDPRTVEANWSDYIGRLDALAPRATSRVRIGVSPHAPYSVSGPLYARAAAHAREKGMPLAVHLAESAAESELLVEGTGGFARMLKSRGIPLPGVGGTPVAWLDQHGVLGPRTLCIHTVRAGEQDIMTMRERGVSVAHCPRSNRAHGHGDAPLRRILEAGIPTGVGTDSVASVSPLDLMAEVRLARTLGGLTAEDALSLVTTGAARALGLQDEVGALMPGHWADLVAIRAGDVDDPYEAVAASGQPDVAGTWLGGRQVAGEMTS